MMEKLVMTFEFNEANLKNSLAPLAQQQCDQPKKTTTQKTQGIKLEEQGGFTSYFVEGGKDKCWKSSGPHWIKRRITLTTYFFNITYEPCLS